MKESYYDSAASNMFASIRIVFEINLKSRVRGKNSNVDCSCKDEYVKLAASLGRKVRGSRVYGESQERERIEQLKGKGKGRLELKVLNKMKRGVSRIWLEELATKLSTWVIKRTIVKSLEEALYHYTDTKERTDGQNSRRFKRILAVF